MPAYTLMIRRMEIYTNESMMGYLQSCKWTISQKQIKTLMCNF